MTAPTRQPPEPHQRKDTTPMNIRKCTASVVAGLALLALSGCADGSAEPASWPAVTTEPDTLDLPELPGELDLGQISEGAFVDTVDGEGIVYPDRESLLATGYEACEAMQGTSGVGGDIFSAIEVFVADGYLQDDAAFMAGAAFGSLCLAQPGAGV